MPARRYKKKRKKVKMPFAAVEAVAGWMGIPRSLRSSSVDSWIDDQHWRRIENLENIVRQHIKELLKEGPAYLKHGLMFAYEQHVNGVLDSNSAEAAESPLFWHRFWTVTLTPCHLFTHQCMIRQKYIATEAQDFSHKFLLNHF
ncbi:hypothetical protein B0H10DRAFT_1944135 [Mycena sp. CBHHK59/15]|nr:hypothetical protein B0H10DRAFT_1944135 [Mycena sp. CBHHK59/15]